MNPLELEAIQMVIFIFNTYYKFLHWKIKAKVYNKEIEIIILLEQLNCGILFYSMNKKTNNQKWIMLT